MKPDEMKLNIKKISTSPCLVITKLQKYINIEVKLETNGHAISGRSLYNGFKKLMYINCLYLPK